MLMGSCPHAANRIHTNLTALPHKDKEMGVMEREQADSCTEEQSAPPGSISEQRDPSI